MITNFNSLEVLLLSFTEIFNFKKMLAANYAKIDKMEYRAIMKYLHLKGLLGKEIYRHRHSQYSP